MATRKKKSSRKNATHREPADEHAATELVMFIENTSDLSPDGPSGQGHSVLLNALRKWRKGTYDPTMAVRLFEYLTEAGAKRYQKEFGSDSPIFNPATRHEAARQLEASFRSSVERGEYDHVDTRVGARSEEVSEAARNPSPRGLVRERGGDRPIGMTYGTLPPFEKFERDIRRPNPDESDGGAYWPPGTIYPMELVDAHEIELAEDYGLNEFEAERRKTGRHSGVRGFRGNEEEIYGFLKHLVECLNDGDDGAGDLASSIMTTLGYEWI